MVAGAAVSKKDRERDRIWGGLALGVPMLAGGG